MAQRKETKKTIQVRDLKPKKDAKGGASGRNLIFGHQNQNQSHNQNQNQSRNQTFAGG
jgi:hypothetical protein